MTQGKAQPAINGYSLNKGCNVVLDRLWASRLADMCTICVAPHKVSGG
jgi:hypothetical protein